ncbi:MAG: 23S rRNA (guanosine(2251)-2'-O)-methyltransferase RlmB [Succinivibrio sp.]|jgi:23S rRNA (guanosine2251-2'-O)-methyltransferase|nr:23S rRNA (guanosine(2251)-2'-O)-methyltransferase RlmB [Succinivibrio sp.]
MSKKSSSREIVYGVNPVFSALETSPEKITAAWVAKGREGDRRVAQIIKELEANGIRVQGALSHFLDEKTDGGVHQGVVIEMLATPARDEHYLQDLVESLEGQEQLYLVLDGITDPRNLGACMRSAWAAGCKAVIVPRDKSAPLSPVARKAADGAAEAVPFVAVTNLARALDFMRDHGIEVVGLAGEGAVNIFSYGFQKASALVLGSEESGMRRLTREKCDAIVRIPMAEGVESLNVSVASGVALFEAVRSTGALQN